MPGSTFTPFEFSDHANEDAATLQARFAQSGYLFFRNLIDRARIEEVRDRVIGALKAHGFVNEEATSEPTWSGKWPETNELRRTARSRPTLWLWACWKSWRRRPS